MDTTFRGWSSTLVARVRLVISRLVLIFALPLDFHGRVRVVQSMYLPAALHGIEASWLASVSLRKLRSSIRSVVWSRRQPMALQSVQRAEMWGVILALQSSSAVHLGVDNLGVVRHVGRLLDGRPGSTPFELVKDGDLLLLIESMLQTRFGFARSRVMVIIVWWIDLVIVLLVRLLTLVVGESAILSLMLGVICLGLWSLVPCYS